MSASQFGAPRGARGWAAGRMIALLTGDANRWMVDCLDVLPDDRVLDVGCGPGLGVAAAATAATGGFVAGVDVSTTMVRQAGRRNRAAIHQGRVGIQHADAGALPFRDGWFSKAGSLNSMQFWPDPPQALRELHRVLAPGARLVLVLMARSDDPPAHEPPAWVGEMTDLMGDLSFRKVNVTGRSFGGVVHWAMTCSVEKARSCR